MTNMPGNRKNGAKCAICGKQIRGIYNWLCKEHRTPEFAAQANAKFEAEQAKKQAKTGSEVQS